ncbi:MAG TPA: PaaI family thioesterase [bacterium]|nr:PaaI family thioesterase [bacterium]
MTKELPYRFEKTMGEALSMEPIEITPERMVIRMRVTDASRQPAGLLHGGATAALVETVASLGSAIQCPKGTMPVGIEVNCNHLRGKKEGYVEAVGVPVHRGRRTHVWDVKVYDEDRKMIAIGRCTVAITPMDKEE